MKKLLSKQSVKKHIPRKVADVLSFVVVIVTVALLFTSTLLARKGSENVSSASGFAIYKGETEEAEASLMFNVYEGAENVEMILEILRRYSAKATFFIGGIWAEKNHKTLLDIAMEGHELGCHGYLHKDHSQMTQEQNKEEIAICCNLIKNVTGVTVKLFAPPSGAYGKATEAACRALGQKLVMWTKDTIDWRDSDVPTLVKRATKNISKGDLILMHPKSHTVTALPEIVESYLGKGFRLVTVSEMLS